MRPFSRAEMERRASAIRDRMDKAELDALLLTSFPGIYYIGGTPIHQFGRPAALLLPLDGEPFLVTSILERIHVEHQTWVADREYYADHNLDSSYASPQPPLQSLLQLLARAAKRRKIDSGTIGIEDGWLPVSHRDAIAEVLPEARLVAASKLVERQRIVLSDEELALVRAGDAVADAGQTALLTNLSAGLAAPELISASREAMLDVVLDQHADKPFVLHHKAGLHDPGKQAGHSEWATWGRDNVAKTGDILDTVFSCFFWGYWGNVERTICIGEPSGKALHAFETMVEANEAAISAAKPGVTLGALDRITKEVFADRGYGETPFGTGLGRGIASYEHGSRILPLDVRLYSDIVLEPGMAISIEPMLGDYEAPYRHCNTVIITEDGCNVDSSVPRGVLWV